MDFYDKLKYLVESSNPNREFKDTSPRLLIQGNMVLMDVFPTNKLRYNTHFYVLNPNNIILDENSLEELDEFQELELKQMTRGSKDSKEKIYMLSKTV